MRALPKKPAPETGARSIENLSTGASARITCIEGGRELQQRLQMLGIRRGSELRVIQGPGQRGAVIQVGEANFALGKGVIQKILVQEISA